jgi:murein DD-endopeptidase MepM/ murein hydrolase activator NlpD
LTRAGARASIGGVRKSALIAAVLVGGCYSGSEVSSTSAGGGPGGQSGAAASGATEPAETSGEATANPSGAATTANSTTAATGEATTDPTGGPPTETGEPTTETDGPPGPSCGELAAAQGWPSAACEWNGNAACAGHGPATSDCDHCCSQQSCQDHASGQGWHAWACEAGGDAACGGQGLPTTDCDGCCAGPACGDVATLNGWRDPLCEQGDDACKGTGAPTWDCTRCCDGAAPPATGGFGYPVGDLTSYPAGGWSIGQVMAHYLDSYGGRHLAHDVNHPNGGVATIDAPVHAVADGVVRYAGPNNSSYKHMVLIEHAVDGEDPVCSFYGHINAPIVATGQMVQRGQQITSVMDWNLILGGSGNTHLHYGILRKSLCDASAAANGALICGYDEAGPNDVFDLDSEPYSYQPIADICGDAKYGDVFISPTKFIEAHHF